MEPRSPDPALSLLLAAAESEERLREEFRRMLDVDLRMSVREFCASSGLSPSTVYKFTSAGREPSLRTLRAVVKGIRRVLRQSQEPFIAVVAARAFVHEASEGVPRKKGQGAPVREFPAASMEEAIVAAVRAERAGALAVVCAPIVAPTLEKVLAIPVVEISPRGAIREAVRRARSMLPG